MNFFLRIKYFKKIENLILNTVSEETNFYF